MTDWATGTDPRIVDWTTSDSGGGGATTLAALTDVDIPAPADGEVLTFDQASGDWISAPIPTPAGGGGWRDFAEAAVTGGNGGGGNGSFSAVTNLANLVLDAAAGDLIEMDWSAVLFGPQTFFRVVVVGGTTTVNPPGWYRSTDLTNQGSACSGTRRFIVAAGDVVAGQVTLELQGQGTGNPPLILEGSIFEAVNLGQPA